MDLELGPDHEESRPHSRLGTWWRQALLPRAVFSTPLILTMTDFTDDTKMPFGKYKGEKLKDVSASYLLWLYGQMETQKQSQGPLFRYIKANLKVLEKEAEEERDYEAGC